MSGEAMGWEARQRTGDSSAQFVLLVLAMRADEFGGMTEIDVDYVAERTNLSRRTVFRCFGVLRDLGLLETETGFTRSGGRHITGRLVLTASTSEAMRETQPCEGDGDGAESQGCAKSAQPTLCSNRLVINPPNPPAVEPAETRASEGDELDRWFEQFRRTYPFDATMRDSEARAEAEKLSVKDRAKALRWAAAYAADLKARGATRPVDAAKWLRERRFEEVERIKGGQAQAQGLAKPMVFVIQGTPAWNAWLAHKGVRSMPTNTSAHAPGKSGWWFPSLWPPGVDPPPGDADGA